MLRRSVKVQLVIFVIITVLGISYVGLNYVGLLKGVGKDACTVSAEFPDSGGIFSNAEVTYRGVTVGRVGSLHLVDKGVKVDLHLDDCSNPKIPADTRAAVSDRSVIGEQYVNLIPPNDNGPYLHGGEVITMDKTTVPTSPKTLLTDMDALINSVDLDALHTTVDELGQAFNGKGPDLGSLLDSTNKLLTAAEQNLPSTIQLIDLASGVLQTQLDESPALQSFSHSLNLLSQQLKSSDGDIRHLLDTGTGDLATVRSFIQDNRTDLGVTLANLATVGQILVAHIDGLEQILELYPALAAGGPTTLNNGVGKLGIIMNNNMPPDCGDPTKGQQGYEGTKIRTPSDTSPEAPNTAAHCTAPRGSPTNVRGSANVPGGDPVSTPANGNVVYPRAVTGGTILLGNLAPRAQTLGDQSWLAILTDALN